MTRPLEDLALRKQLLHARSTLYRLKIRHELNAMQEALSWSRAGVMALRALPVGSGILTLALQALPRSRLAQLLALGSRMLLLSGLASIAVNLLRKPSAPPPSVRERTDHAVLDL
jgi:hypothetical protein